jgi:hypothetical protein
MADVGAILGLATPLENLSHQPRIAAKPEAAEAGHHII